MNRNEARLVFVYEVVVGWLTIAYAFSPVTKSSRYKRLQIGGE